ncbi:MAG TPA: hypothetical protein VGE66_02000 [Chitinophagaceae bacterium]
MRKFRTILWRSLVVTLVYTLASTVIGGLVLHSAEGMAPPANPALLLATTFISGFLIGVTLGPLAARLHASRLRSMMIYTTAVFLNMASVVIEGHFFAPGLLPLAVVPRMVVLHALIALVTGGTLSFLFPAQQPAGTVTATRTSPSWAARFLFSAAAYLLFYYGFGAVNYALVTGPYYEAHPTLLAVPQPGTVLMVASIRSAIIILSLLPLVLALRTSRRAGALWCGLTLFIIGGVLPLLMQAGLLPPLLLVASGVEIFFQNFLAGAVAGLLLGQPKASPASLHVVPVLAQEEKV